MPSQSKRLVIFGDSNLATVRHALDEGALTFGRWEHEFWGAAGPEFRHIHFGKGALQAIKPAAEKMVLLVNGQGRKTLRAKDFDLFVFYGARLRLAEFFAPYLDLMMDDTRAVSDAVLCEAAEAFLQDRRSVRMAQKLKAAGAKRVTFAYAGFPVWGVIDQTEEGRILAEFPRAQAAGAAERDRLWRALDAGFATRGLTLLRQPDETVVHGMFTAPEFALPDAAEKEDASHKAPAYAAQVLAGVTKA